ncbi:MAG: response regulator [Proteobacteria bacterium]|uniref:ATP-binding protein n=1 Tax=Aquabacterium sp. TaxID=1872578 RepID=UPI0035C6C2BA|nr:response regulator [Pseudomonadota bacterium]
MKLRTVSRWFFVLVVAGLLANFAFLLFIRTAYVSAEQTTQRRADTLRLVSELQNEAVLLRRLVSAYTASGAPRYLLYYYDVLAIREGRKAPPLGPDPMLYWNEVIAGQRAHALPQGVAGASVQDRMHDLDFSREERDAVSAVLRATEELKKTEQVAFAATQGLYDPRRQAYVSDGVPDLAYATRLVHSAAYETQSAELARALSVLGRITDARTDAGRSQASAQLERYIQIAIGLDLALLPGLLLALYTVRTRVLRPIDRLGHVARRLARGDYATRSGGRHQWVEELDTLGVTLNVMAHAVQDDVNQRARAQQELREARDQAEAATRAKSMFLANMSHEIRTPMNAIVGMTHLALQTPLTEQQRDYLGKVQSASAMLLGVINDILDFSKIEAGKLTLESAPMRIDTVVNDAMMMVRQRAQDKGIELRCEFVSPEILGERGLIHGDALRLGQVLANLLSNAVKFTERGHVTLRVRLSDWAPMAATLHIEVEDSGIGMDEDQLHHLFSEFTQADGSTTRRYGGTGLGLSITRRLVALMGGDILVQSAPSQGSTFFIQLPVVPARLPGLVPGASGAGDAARDERLRLDGLRVLLVEDNVLNQQLASELLARRGALVTVAGHGLEALALLRQPGAHFDVVLMDLQMPVMDGYQAAEAIRQNPQLQGLPVLAMTAHAMVEERERCLALGMQGHLSKPLDPAALYAALRPYLPGRLPEQLPGQAPDPVLGHVLGHVPGHQPGSPAAAPGTPAAGQGHEPAPAPDWPELPGVDRRQAETYFLGDTSLYRQTLHAFVEHMRSLLPRLPVALQDHDWVLLTREGHTLKGLARTVGHGTLAERARTLERLGPGGDQAEIERAVALVVDAAVPFVDALERVLGPAHPLPQALVPAAPEAAVVQRLARLAADFDGQALSLWQRHRNAFAAWLPPTTFARLDDALARCDFDAAARHLQELQPAVTPPQPHPESTAP